MEDAKRLFPFRQFEFFSSEYEKILLNQQMLLGKVLHWGLGDLDKMDLASFRYVYDQVVEGLKTETKNMKRNLDSLERRKR